MGEEEHVEVSGDDELSHQKCEAADVTLAGGPRKNLAGMSRRAKELGKYFLLGDDILPSRPDVRAAFLCDHHGEEYITAIRNARCSHAPCWHRGSLRGRDGEWMMECPYRMQSHFDKTTRQHEKEGKAMSAASLRRKWDKTPEPTEPGSPSGTKSTKSAAPVGQGMAVAACPDPNDTNLDEKPPNGSVSTSEKTTKETSQIPRQDSRLHIEKDSRLGDISALVPKEVYPTTTEKPGDKPGILLNAQVEAATKQLRKMTASCKDEREQQQTEQEGNTDLGEEESPGDVVRRRTVKRKGMVQASSDSDQPGDSWEEVRSHFNRDSRKRQSRDAQEGRGHRNAIRWIHRSRRENEQQVIIVPPRANRGIQ